jgi:ribokinase
MILVAGSANLDFVVRADHIPAPGETVLGRDFKTFPGGKGANQAVACARAGAMPTHMLLALGDDAFAVPLEASLQGAGVVMHIVREAQAPTGTAFICLSEAGENAITVAPGANASLQPEHLPALAGFTHLLLQLETPLDTVTAYAEAARAAGVAVVLNAAPAQQLPAQLLGLVDILIVNEGELATVSQCDGSIAECLQQLQVPTVVVTLGAHGCCARHLGAFHLQAAFAVPIVDTTGAGDTFCGSFAAALCRGLPMDQALRYASAAGALACTRLGAQSSIPMANEVDSLLLQQPQNNTPAKLDALRALCGLT